MPTPDDRLTDAIRGAVREPMANVDGVLQRVQAKRARRQTVRRTGLATAALGLVGAVVAGSLVLTSGDDQREVAVGPDPGAAPTVRVDGRRTDVTHTRVRPDEGYVRGPLLVTDELITFAAYDRTRDGYTFPPSRVVRVRADGRVVDRVDLQGEILSLASGEGARWALTRDKEVLGPEDPEFRVKRIGPDDSVVSNPVPPGEQPTGSIAAGGGGVWVPVRDGVLHYDPVTGGIIAKIQLSATTDSRAVVIGPKFAVVTDGRGYARLDPSEDVALTEDDPVTAEVDEILGAARPAGDGSVWLLGANTSRTRYTVVRDQLNVTLPADFVPFTIQAILDRVWAVGTAGGAYTAVLVEQRDGALTTVRTVRLGRDRDAALAFASDTRAVIVSGGSLFRADLGG